MLLRNDCTSEVNLKIKQAPQATSNLTNPTQISRLQAIVKSEQPNNRLYNYEGTLSVVSMENGGRPKDYPLDPTQLLLRGAQLRNTSWVYGAVVFTGHESKLMLNSRYGPLCFPIKFGKRSVKLTRFS